MKIVAIIFLLFNSTSKSLNLMDNKKNWIIVDESTKIHPQPISHLSNRIHTMLNSHGKMKGWNFEKINAFGDILVDKRNHIGHRDVNVGTKNEVFVVNNLMRESSKNYRMLRALNNKGTISHQRIVSIGKNLSGVNADDTEKERKNKSLDVRRKKRRAEERSRRLNRKLKRRLKRTADHTNETPHLADWNEGVVEDTKTDQEVYNNKKEVIYYFDRKTRADDSVEEKNVEKTETTVSNESSGIKEEHEKKAPRRKITHFIADRDQVDKFINSLDHILSSSGDYLVALMLNNYKHRLRSSHMNEKFFEKVRQMASQSGIDWKKAKNQLQRKIESLFGKRFVSEVSNTLKSLARELKLFE